MGIRRTPKETRRILKVYRHHIIPREVSIHFFKCYVVLTNCRKEVIESHDENQAFYVFRIYICLFITPVLLPTTTNTITSLLLGREGRYQI